MNKIIEHLIRPLLVFNHELSGSGDESIIRGLFNVHLSEMQSDFLLGNCHEVEHSLDKLLQILQIKFYRYFHFFLQIEDWRNLC